MPRSASSSSLHSGSCHWYPEWHDFPVNSYPNSLKLASDSWLGQNVNHIPEYELYSRSFLRWRWFFYLQTSTSRLIKFYLGVLQQLSLFLWQARASGVTGEGQGGRVPPRDFWPGNLCWPIGKKEARKKGKRVENGEEKRKEGKL